MNLQTKFKSYDKMKDPIRFAVTNPDAWIWIKTLPGSESALDVTPFFFDDSIDHIEFDRQEDAVAYKLKFGPGV